MKLQFVRPHKSIMDPVTHAEISDFLVLSGPNGSGKSNLLEAIRDNAITIEGVSLQQPPSHPVRLFTLAQLVAAEETQQPRTRYRDGWIPIQQAVGQAIAEFTHQPYSLKRESYELEDQVRSRMLAMRQVTESMLHSILSRTGKDRIVDLTDNDFRSSAPLINGVRDPFSMTATELFLTYHDRYERNLYNRWREEKGHLNGRAALADEEFIERYGPPPWEVLNETLILMGLDYHYRPPSGDEEGLPYEAVLVDEVSGIEVGISQLSSGERTLMALVMSLYTGMHLTTNIELPRVLLLDEPDAVLHPSMVRTLLRVVDDLFHQRFGIKVILVTHAPTTVALAPEESLYTMRRSGQPRLVKADRDRALSALLVGVPTISIRNDNRIQVFVESEVDEDCYQKLYTLLRQHIGTPFSLEFIASGKGGQGNAQQVVHLVNNLRLRGNRVSGIVDADARGGTPEGIYYIAGRRSLENLVLDPLPVGVFLLREKIIKSEQVFGAPLRHFQLRPDDVAPLVNYVVSKVRRDGDDMTDSQVNYVGSFSASVPRFYLAMDGHKLEDRLRAAFPKLNKYTGGALKVAVIELAVGDLPDFAPQDIVDLFCRLTTDNTGTADNHR